MDLERNYDPLQRLHSDCFDLIFLHFSASDLLTSSEVSPLWHQSIGASPKCMGKLKISFSYRNAECDLSCNVNNSERQYRNICADFSQYSEENVLEIISQPQQVWRKVEFFDGEIDMENFMENLCETVEDLSLNRVKAKASATNKKYSNFPRLKNLRIFSSSGEFLMNCSTLETLKFSETSSDGSLRKILENNKKLRELTVFLKHFTFSQQMTFDLLEFRLKLTTKATEEDQRCLNDFLLRQSSLKVVAINTWFGLEVLKTCFKMRQLTDFTYKLRQFENELIDWNNIKLAKNTSINRLDISPPHESTNFHEIILSAVPNLKILKTKRMQVNSLNCLAQKCNDLEELYVQNFDLTELQGKILFPKLRKFKAWEVRQDLIENLKAKSKRNHFEELILKY